MSPTDHAIDALRRFDGLARLDEQALRQIAEQAQLQRATPGSCLLPLGATDKRQLLLLDGELLLEAGDGATHRVRHSDNAARTPVSRLRPSRYRVTALTEVRYLLIDEALLDRQVLMITGSMVVEESVLVSEPNGLLDDTASHPIMFDLFHDLNRGQLVVPSDREVAIRIGRALDPGEQDHVRLAGLLAACPALTVKVLRAARAGGAPNFRNIRSAVARLGAEDIFALTVNCALRESLRTPSTLVLERMHLWWERTMQVAAVAGTLARMSERFDPGYAHLIGLLHSIAEPVLLAYADRHPDLADPHQLDHVVHGNRAEVGRILLTMWELPKDAVDAAAMCNRWGYDHPGEANYTDIVLAAQWFVASAGRTGRRPPADEIPAMRRFGLHRASHETEARIVAARDAALDEISSLLED